MKILILCLPGIGDALIATPMIELLRKKFPKARIDILCMFETVSYIFKNNHDIDNVYFLPLYTENKIKSVFNLLKLRKEKYDVSILAFPAFRKEYHVVHRIIGAKKRISNKFRRGYFKEFNFLETDLVEVDENVHNVINNLNLLRALGLNWEKYSKNKTFSYKLILNKTDVIFGKEYLRDIGWKGESIIGFHPGSIDSPAGVLKRWPVENFTILAKKLIARNKKVLIFCGPFEKPLGNRIVQGVSDVKNCRLVNVASFGQSLGILQNLNLFISNDNGFAHISNALKVKNIVLFGPTNPSWCSPYNMRYSTSIRKARFTPWFRNDIKVTDNPKGVRSGMEEIRVSDVLSKLEEV